MEVRRRLGLLRLAGIFALAAPALAPAQVVYTPTFTASNVNLWGAGSADIIDFSHYYGVSWNASGSIGGIEHTFLGDWGAEAFGSTSGRVGVDIGFKSTSGGVNINLPYRVTITPSSVDMSAAGTYSINVASALNVAAGQSVVTTQFPNASVTVGGDLAAKVAIGGEIAAYDSVRGSTTLFDFDAGKFPIFAYNQNSDNKVSIFGGDGIPVGTGITVGLPTSNQRPDSGSAQHGTIFSGLPVGVTLGTLTVAAPSNTLNGVSGSGFTAHGSQPTLLALQADVLGMAMALAGLPVNPLDLRADLFGISFNGKLFSGTVGVAAGLSQDVTLNQSLAMKLRSSAPVTYHLPDGSTQTTTEFIVTNLNTSLTFDKPDGDVAIFPEFYLLDPRIRSELDLTLGLAFSIEALKFSASKYGASLGTLGPVFSYKGVVPVVDPTIFDETFAVGQLGYHVFGASFNNVQPTIGNIAADEVVQFHNRSGLFATTAIDGSLDVAEGAAYINSTSLTIGTGGALAVQSAATAGPASSFITAGLTNQGTIYVGAGSRIEISGGASAFTNLSGGTLTGGTYVVEGTLSIPNATIATNAANLWLTGGTLDNLAGGNGFTALTRNTAAGNLNVYQDFAFDGTFTNEGSFRANSTLVTAPAFTNASGATASVTAGTLRIGAPWTGTTTFTNNGILNVLGGDLEIQGLLGNITGTTSGTLTGGTWNIGGALTYGMYASDTRPLRTIAADTTVNLFYGGSFRNWNLGGSNDGIQTVKNNQGVFRLIGSSVLMDHSLTNSGTILVTPDGAGHAATLSFHGTLNNASGSIQVDAGAKLSATYGDYYTDPVAWTNVSADGILSNIGQLNLGGTLEYIGPKITALSGDLTLAGNAWSIEHLFGTFNTEREAGLALSSVQGALRLANAASFSTQPAGAFTLTNGTLEIGVGSTFVVDRGSLAASASATILNQGTLDFDRATFTATGPAITNNGAIRLLHAGTTPATLDVAANLTLGGTGSLQLSNLATNQILSTGGTLTNGSTHVIAGAGLISAPLVNLGTIQSLGSAGLTLTGAITNTGLILAHGESTTTDFSTYTYTPAPLTLSGITVNNYDGDILSASLMTMSDTTVNDGDLGTLAAGRLRLANATLNSVALSNAEGGVIEIAAGTTTTFDDTTLSPASLTNNAGATFEIGDAGRLALLTAAPFVNRGALLLGAGAKITEEYVGYYSGIAKFQNYGRIQFAGADSTAAIDTDFANYDTGVMDFSDGNTLRVNGGTFLNNGRILLGNAGTTGTLSFYYLTDLTGGGSIQLGGLVKTTTDGVDSYHWENSGVVRGYGLLTNVDNTIAGAGTIGTGDLTFINGSSGIIHASAPGGTLTVHAGVGGFFDDRTGFTNQGLLKIDAGATLEILTTPGVFNNLVDGALYDGRYEVAGTLRIAATGIITNNADLTLTGAGRIENTAHANLLTSLDTNLQHFRLQGGATLALNQPLSNWGDIVLGGAGPLAGGTLTTPALFGPSDSTVTLADSTAQLRLGNGDGFGFAGLISGSGSLAKVGVGTQGLLGANTYTGGTTISAGSLLVGHAAALGTGDVTLAGGSLASEVVGLSVANNLVLTGNSGIRTGTTNGLNTGDLALTGVIAGTDGRSLTKIGTGMLTLSGANTYNGSTIVNQGSVVAGHDSAFGTSTLYLGNATLQGDTTSRTLANTIYFNGVNSAIANAAALTLTGQLTGFSNYIGKTGAGTLTLTGSNTFAGNFALSQGTLVLGHDNALGFASLSLGDATLQADAARTIANSVNFSGSGTIGGSHDLTLTGQMSGSGSLTKTGVGTLTLTHASGAQTGAIRLEAGTLAAGGDSAFGTGTLTLAGGTLSASGGSHSLANVVAIESSSTIGGSFDLTLQGTVSGLAASTLTKTGAGTLTFSNTNTFAGTTQVLGGLVQFATANGLGTGALTLDGGGLRWAAGTTADISSRLAALGPNGAHFDTNGNNITFASALSGGALVKAGAGTLTLAATNTFTGGLTVTGGLIEFSALNNFGTGSITLNGGGLRWATGSTVDASPRLAALGGGGGTFDTNGNNVTLGSVLSGTGGLTKLGGGILTLAATNTYAGGTQINGGTLRISAHDNLGGAAGDLGLSGGTLQLGADLSLSRAVTLGTDGGTVDTNGHALSLSAGPGGTGALTKTGAGTLTLGGAATYSGGTTLSAGILVAANDAALGTGSLTLAGGSLRSDDTLRTLANAITLATDATFDGTGPLALAGAISGAHALTKTGAGTLTLTGANTYSGGTTVSGGTLVGNAASLAGVIANQTAITFDQAADGTFSGAISGTGALAKTGAGSLTLAGANAYSGGTTLTAGTLVVADDGALGTGALTFAGGTLLASGTRTLAGPVNLTGAAVIGGADSLRLDGVISGIGTLTKTGSGSLWLTQASARTGDTVIGAGTLFAAHDQVFGTGTLVLDGGTLRSDGNARTFANNVSLTASSVVASDAALTFLGAVSGTGGLVKTGTGDLFLANTNTYSGGTTLSGGFAEFTALASFGTGAIRLDGGGLRWAAGHSADVSSRLSLFGPGSVTFDTNGNNVTFANSVFGENVPAAFFTKTGSGTLTLAAANNFNRTVRIAGGTIAVGNNDSLGADTIRLAGGALTSTGGAHTLYNTIELDADSTVGGDSDLTLRGVIGYDTQLHALTKIGSGTLTLTGENFHRGMRLEAGTLVGNNTYAFGDSYIDLAGGTLQVTGLMTTLYNPVYLTGDAAIGGSTSFNIVSAISGSSPSALLRKTGTNTLTLSGANTYAGSTRLESGTLVVAADGALGTGTLTLAGGALRGDGTAHTLGNSVELLLPAYTFDGNSDLTFTGALLNHSGGDLTLTFDNPGTTSFGGAVLSDSATARTLTLSGNGNAALTGAVQDGVATGGRLVKDGPGVLTLTGANSYTGGTDVLGGLIEFLDNLSFGTGDVGLDGGGLRWSDGSTVDISARLRPLGTHGGTFDTNGSDVTFASALSGPGALIKAGAGSLTLAPVNTYTGGTLVTGGTIALGPLAAFGSGNITLDGGGLRWTNASTTDIFTRLNPFGANGGVIDTNGFDVTFPSALSGAGPLVKTGAGTLALTTANDFAGVRLVAGTLAISGNDAFGPGGLTFDGGTLRPTVSFTLERNPNLTANGGTIDTPAGVTLQTDRALSGTGVLIKTGEGTLFLYDLDPSTAQPNTSGGLRLDQGTLWVNSDSKLGAANAPLTFNGGTLESANYSGPLTLERPVVLSGDGFFSSQSASRVINLNRAVSGPGALHVSGGPLTLATANDYTGGTVIAGAGTVQFANAAALGSGAVSLDGGTLGWNGGGDATVSNAFAPIGLNGATLAAYSGTLTLSAPLTSAAGATGWQGQLTIAGAGVVALTGINSHRGTTVTSGATLGAGSDASLGAADALLTLAGYLRPLASFTADRAGIAAGGGFETPAGVELTWNGAITGTSLTKTGSGTLTLAGNNTFTDGLVLSAGTLAIGHDSALGSGAFTFGGGTVRSDGTAHSIGNTMEFGPTGIAQGTFAGAIAGSSNLTFAGPVRLNAATSTLTVTNTGLTTFSGDFSPSGWAYDPALTIGNSGPVALTGTINDGGGYLMAVSLTKNGSGSLTLGGNNTFTGTTTLNEGSLVLSHASALQASTLALAGGALDFGSLTSATLGGLSGSTGLALVNSLGAPVALSVGSATSSTYSGSFSGAGSLTKVGSGTLTVSGAAGQTGGTTVAAGTLSLANSPVLGNVDVQSGATLALNGQSVTIAALTGAGTMQVGGSTSDRARTLTFAPTGSAVFAGVISGYGTLVIDGPGSQALAAGQQFRGPLYLNRGTLVASAETSLGGDVTESIYIDGGTLRAAASMGIGTRSTFQLGAAGATFSPDAATTLSLGAMSGPGALLKTGAGTVALNGINTYTGGTTIGQGTLQFGPNSSVIGDIVNNGTVRTGVNGLILPNNISGSGSFLKGAGSITLTGTNTYTGLTTIQGQTLTIGNNGSTGSIVGNVAFFGPPGTLRFNRSDDLTYSGIISSPGGGTNLSTGEFIPQTGNLSKRGAGTLTLTGANTFLGSTTIEAGTLAIAADTALGTAPATATSSRLVLNGGALGTTATFALDANRGLTLGASGGALAAAAGTTLTYGGVIAGTGPFTKSGGGTLVLSGVSTYTGATTVAAGRLELEGSVANSPFTVSGGTLSGRGTVGALSIASGGILAPGNSPGTLSAGDTIFAGGGIFEFQINDATGTAGTNWDSLNIAGTLDLSQLADADGFRFTFSLVSLTAENATGLLAHFNPAQNYAFTVASATSGILGFNGDAFSIDRANFVNSAPGTWSLGLGNDSHDLNLAYTASAIPEPSTYAMLFGLAALGLALACRRRRAAS